MSKHTNRTRVAIPRDAEVVRTYADLATEVARFVSGGIKLLIVIGGRGCGKSETIAAALPDAQTLQGAGRAWPLYCQLYQHRNRVLVLNESSQLFRQPQALDLLKVCTEQKPVCKVCWSYSRPAPILLWEVDETDPSAIAPSFTTTSRLVMLSNQWEDTPHTAAIASRATLLYFAPPAAEMHRHAATFYRGRPEVFSFIGDRLAQFEEMDLRSYQQANDRADFAERTKLGKEYWQRYIDGLVWKDPRKKVAWRLMLDKSLRSDNERARVFHSLTGASERMFYRVRELLAHRIDTNGKPTASKCQRTEGESEAVA